MTDRLDRDDIARQQRDQRQREKWEEERFRADLQHVMKEPALRRVMWRFWKDVGLDGSPFATNAMAQSHAIGLKDAAMWWVNAIRAHCPEREAQIRNEANSTANTPKPEEDADVH